MPWLVKIYNPEKQNRNIDNLYIETRARNVRELARLINDIMEEYGHDITVKSSTLSNITSPRYREKFPNILEKFAFLKIKKITMSEFEDS